jgi:AhpD family alkylhydroperoxidase
MSARMSIPDLEPAAYKAMVGLEKYLAQCPLPKSLLLLIKIRASQINGCAFCVDMHSTHAKEGGETDPRLWAVAVWQEAPCFTEVERAALEFTEASTRLSESSDRVSDDVWDRTAKHFDEHEMAALVVAVATINAWNRIAGVTHTVPASFAS